MGLSDFSSIASAGTDRSRSPQVFGLFGLVIGFVAGLAAAGCATGAGAADDRSADDASQREVPAEVSDHTVDGRKGGNPTLRPRVDLQIDRGELRGVEMQSYEAKVRRSAQECYSREIRMDDSKAEGGMVYEVLVTRNGRVAGTDLMSTEVENDTIQSCVERAIGRLRFDVSVQNRPFFRLFFRFDFYFETVVPSEPPV